jgi:methylmalonyl-CoA mutase N-terminal domain/subunit
LLHRIDALGGTLAAIEAGYIQRQIQESAYKTQLAVDAGESVVVGVNKYQTDEAAGIELFEIDPELERQQAARVQALRAARDGTAWRAALDAVASAAAGSDNLVPAIIAAVEARATVGEIADTMRGVFGEYREVSLD